MSPRNCHNREIIIVIGRGDDDNDIVVVSLMHKSTAVQHSSRNAVYVETEMAADWNDKEINQLLAACVEDKISL